MSLLDYDGEQQSKKEREVNGNTRTEVDEETRKVVVQMKADFRSEINLNVDY